jgi:hypothetical protein
MVGNIGGGGQVGAKGARDGGTSQRKAVDYRMAAQGSFSLRVRMGLPRRLRQRTSFKTAIQFEPQAIKLSEA